MTNNPSAKIALVTRSVDGGGVQKMLRHLAAELMARGYTVDLVSRASSRPIHSNTGANVYQLSRTWPLHARRLALRAAPEARTELIRPVLTPLIAPEPLSYLPALTQYLREHRPDAVISATTYLNVTVLLARRLAGTQLPVLISERDNLSHVIDHGRSRRAWRWRHAPPLLNRLYRDADAIVCVSRGVSDDLAARTGLPRNAITTIYNPVITADLDQQAKQPTGEPWLDEKTTQVILGGGRLVGKKRLQDLVAVFSELRKTRKLRLVIFGTGRERGRLERQVRDLGLDHAVLFTGWTPNPYAYMARADVFVLSSEREGAPSVLVEALACGCPVVSTDCPSGPREILDGGVHGPLVPVGDRETLSRAITTTLDANPDPKTLRKSVATFTAESAATQYLAALFGAPQPP